jgi:hypothetical protein
MKVYCGETEEPLCAGIIKEERPTPAAGMHRAERAENKRQ